MGLWELPSIEPPDEFPNCEQHIPTATVRSVRDALLSDGEQAALTAYFYAAGCADVVVSPWLQGCRQIGTKIQRSRYKAPSPGDLPEILCRAMGIPKWIQGETLSCVGPLQELPDGDEKVVLGQHVWAEGICYSDLFRIQILHEFSTCQNGGVTWRQWLSVHWMKSLPWSQLWLAKIIEKRAKYEGRFTAKSFVHVIATSSEYIITSNAKSRSESADGPSDTVVAL